MSDQSNNRAFWRANLRLVTLCLLIWAVASYSAAILFRPMLCGAAPGASELFCWVSRHGPVLMFLILIVFYAWRMNALDPATDAEDE